MLPARQLANACEGQLGHGGQAGATEAAIVARGAPGGVTENRALHVGGLHLAAVDLNLAVGADEGLGDVQGVVVVLGEAQRDGDGVLAGAGPDRVHLGRGHPERVLDVLDVDVEVHRAAPVQCEGELAGL